MKILVTGANGLLGHHVVMQLQQYKEYKINLILRGQRYLFFDKTRTEIFIGSFTDYTTLKNAAKNCDAIIHLAAITSTNLLRFNDYRNINTLGAQNVIKIANELNINKLIFVSTTNTIGYGDAEKAGDETYKIEFPFSNSFYAQSKLEAENLFIEASKKENRHVVIIHPSFMIGSHDTKPSSGKLLLMGYTKPFLLVPKGGKNFVAVSDVATAICNALHQGKNGERYITSGVNISFKEFYKIQSRVGGYKQKIVLIPNFLIKIIGKIGDFIRICGIRSEISSMNLNQLIIQEYYENKKAIDCLDMPQKPIEIAIKETLDWFKHQNKI